MASIKDQIAQRLAVLKPELLTIVDNSASHAGHAGAMSHAIARGSVHAAGTAVEAEGTHFEISVVSAAFAGKPLVMRHRMIYELLDDLMKTQIQALKIDAKAAP